jgi:hypothetical protein
MINKKESKKILITFNQIQQRLPIKEHKNVSKSLNKALKIPILLKKTWRRFTFAIISNINFSKAPSCFLIDSAFTLITKDL